MDTPNLDGSATNRLSISAFVSRRAYVARPHDTSKVGKVPYLDTSDERQRQREEEAEGAAGAGAE